MSDNIHVAVRVRPLIKREKLEGGAQHWKIENKNKVYQVDSNGQQVPGTSYHFDRVFDVGETNSAIYSEVCRPIVESVMQGFNGTIFAYGQTSSGKTYTMIGNNSSWGVIPSTIYDIFDEIENMPEREFLLRVSYMEIYNEMISDLLSSSLNQNLKIHENVDGQVFVKQLTEEVINSPEQVMTLMKKGTKYRHTGETCMNETSSRSHAIFRMIIESRMRSNDVDEVINVSQLNLVDLGGSERAVQTGATGERLKEGIHINLSLLTLGNVISRLSEGDQQFVNYRDSKLTRILQNSLGGNAHTAIICTVTPAVIEQTHSTLKFASRAKCIKNKPIVNEVLNDAALLKRYARTIQQLTKQLEQEKQKNCLKEVVAMKQQLKEKDQDKLELEHKIKELKEKFVVSRYADYALTQRRFRRETWAGPVMKKPSLFPLKITDDVKLPVKSVEEETHLLAAPLDFNSKIISPLEEEDSSILVDNFDFSGLPPEIVLRDIELAEQQKLQELSPVTFSPVVKRRRKAVFIIPEEEIFVEIGIQTEMPHLEHKDLVTNQSYFTLAENIEILKERNDCINKEFNELQEFIVLENQILNEEEKQCNKELLERIGKLEQEHGEHELLFSLERKKWHNREEELCSQLQQAYEEVTQIKEDNHSSHDRFAEFNKKIKSLEDQVQFLQKENSKLSKKECNGYKQDLPVSNNSLHVPAEIICYPANLADEKIDTGFKGIISNENSTEYLKSDLEHQKLENKHLTDTLGEKVKELEYVRQKNSDIEEELLHLKEQYQVLVSRYTEANKPNPFQCETSSKTSSVAIQTSLGLDNETELIQHKECQLLKYELQFAQEKNSDISKELDNLKTHSKSLISHNLELQNKLQCLHSKTYPETLSVAVQCLPDEYHGNNNLLPNGTCLEEVEKTDCSVNTIASFFPCTDASIQTENILTDWDRTHSHDKLHSSENETNANEVMVFSNVCGKEETILQSCCNQDFLQVNNSKEKNNTVENIVVDQINNPRQNLMHSTIEVNEHSRLIDDDICMKYMNALQQMYKTEFGKILQYEKNQTEELRALEQFLNMVKPEDFVKHNENKLHIYKHKLKKFEVIMKESYSSLEDLIKRQYENLEPETEFVKDFKHILLLTVLNKKYLCQEFLNLAAILNDWDEYLKILEQLRELLSNHGLSLNLKVQSVVPSLDTCIEVQRKENAENYDSLIHENKLYQEKTCEFEAIFLNSLFEEQRSQREFLKLYKLEIEIQSEINGKFDQLQQKLHERDEKIKSYETRIYFNTELNHHQLKEIEFLKNQLLNEKSLNQEYESKISKLFQEKELLVKQQECELKDLENKFNQEMASKILETQSRLEEERNTVIKNLEASYRLQIDTLENELFESKDKVINLEMLLENEKKALKEQYLSDIRNLESEHLKKTEGMLEQCRKDAEREQIEEIQLLKSEHYKEIEGIQNELSDKYQEDLLMLQRQLEMHKNKAVQNLEQQYLSSVQTLHYERDKEICSLKDQMEKHLEIRLAASKDEMNANISILKEKIVSDVISEKQREVETLKYELEQETQAKISKITEALKQEQANELDKMKQEMESLLKKKYKLEFTELIKKFQKLKTFGNEDYQSNSNLKAFHNKFVEIETEFGSPDEAQNVKYIHVSDLQSDIPDKNHKLELLNSKSEHELKMCSSCCQKLRGTKQAYDELQEECNKQRSFLFLTISRNEMQEEKIKLLEKKLQQCQSQETGDKSKQKVSQSTCTSEDNMNVPVSELRSNEITLNKELGIYRLQNAKLKNELCTEKRRVRSLEEACKSHSQKYVQLKNEIRRITEQKLDSTFKHQASFHDERSADSMNTVYPIDDSEMPGGSGAVNLIKMGILEGQVHEKDKELKRLRKENKKLKEQNLLNLFSEKRGSNAENISGDDHNAVLNENCDKKSLAESGQEAVLDTVPSGSTLSGGNKSKMPQVPFKTSSLRSHRGKTLPSLSPSCGTVLRSTENCTQQ